jgi:hypothetical protein
MSGRNSVRDGTATGTSSLASASTDMPLVSAMSSTWSDPAQPHCPRDRDKCPGRGGTLVVAETWEQPPTLCAYLSQDCSASHHLLGAPQAEASTRVSVADRIIIEQAWALFADTLHIVDLSPTPNYLSLYLGMMALTRRGQFLSFHSGGQMPEITRQWLNNMQFAPFTVVAAQPSIQRKNTLVWCVQVGMVVERIDFMVVSQKTRLRCSMMIRMDRFGVGTTSTDVKAYLLIFLPTLHPTSVLAVHEGIEFPQSILNLMKKHGTDALLKCGGLSSCSGHV